jgi:hypothetical protein
MDPQALTAQVSLEEDNKKLKAQLSKAVSLNDALWKRISHQEA